MWNVKITVLVMLCLFILPAAVYAAPGTVYNIYDTSGNIVGSFTKIELTVDPSKLDNNYVYKGIDIGIFERQDSVNAKIDYDNPSFYKRIITNVNKITVDDLGSGMLSTKKYYFGYRIIYQPSGVQANPIITTGWETDIPTGTTISPIQGFNIVQVSPQNNSFMVPVSTSISAVFDKPIGTITPSGISVTDNSTGAKVSVTPVINPNNKNILDIKGSSPTPMKANTTYMVRISKTAVKSIEGTGITNCNVTGLDIYQWSFTTGECSCMTDKVTAANMDISDAANIYYPGNRILVRVDVSNTKDSSGVRYKEIQFRINLNSGNNKKVTIKNIIGTGTKDASIIQHTESNVQQDALSLYYEFEFEAKEPLTQAGDKVLINKAEIVGIKNNGEIEAINVCELKLNISDSVIKLT